MSDDTKGLSDIGQVVAITPEDCVAALDFWKHFNIPVSSSMQAAFEAFAQDPSYFNQLRIKKEITREIVESKHEAFSDEMFKKLKEECQDTAFDIAFDEQLEEILTVDKKKE